MLYHSMMKKNIMPFLNYTLNKIKIMKNKKVNNQINILVADDHVQTVNFTNIYLTFIRKRKDP